jgi:hypothetical protein
MIVSVLEKGWPRRCNRNEREQSFRRYSEEGPLELLLTEIEHKGMNGVKLIHAITRKLENRMCELSRVGPSR